MLQTCTLDKLIEKFVYHGFVPSTCFATTPEKWQEFGETRGQALGDEDVCKRCASEGKRCVFPVVPRLKDVGMLHEDGYSVLIHTKDGVKEIKNTYILSNDLIVDVTYSPTVFSELTAGVGKLYSQSTKLIE